MTDRFNRLIGEVLRHEGGYVNDPVDPGGETNFGITKKQYPQLDIKNLTIDDAVEIYRLDYWPDYLDAILDEDLALMVFDFGVNAGVGQAAKKLQEALRVTVDGDVGPQTRRALRDADQLRTKRRFMEGALKYYVTIILRRPASAKFLTAWFRRAIENAVRR